MDGLKTLVLWLSIAIGIAMLECFDEVVNWADKHSGFASWVQAIGSVLAIVLAIWVVQRQHRLELFRRAIADRKALLAVLSGALQMMSAVEGLAKRFTEDCMIQVNAVRGEAPLDLFKLGLLITELDTAVGALSRIDHLKFDEHAFIEGLIVAESAGKVLLQEARNAHHRMLDDGLPRWAGVLTFSNAATNQLKTRCDSIHAANVALSRET